MVLTFAEYINGYNLVTKTDHANLLLPVYEESIHNLLIMTELEKSSYRQLLEEIKNHNCAAVERFCAEYDEEERLKECAAALVKHTWWTKNRAIVWISFGIILMLLLSL